MNSQHESRRRLTITIDGKRYTTRDDDQEAASLLRLAGADPERFDLAKVKRDGEYKVYRDERVVDLADGDEFVTVIFRVSVNEQPVELTGRHQTGASIKAAAIAAGVPIQADFVLSEILPNGKEKVVPDDKQITVKYLDQFWAIPGDDNS